MGLRQARRSNAKLSDFYKDSAGLCLNFVASNIYIL